jgi:pSer/pThr/pTyr-binding forkhead associated (FHA) protein
MLILILVYKSKKKIKEKPLQEIQPIGKNKSENPIEINVKTKGFNKTYFFEKHIISIGRSSGNDIIIPDRTVSGVHAVINKEGDSYMIQDMGSTNGVIIGQKKVKKQQLKLTEKIKLGGAILMIRY